MDVESRGKFEEIERKLSLMDRRFDDTAKRFDDVKWYVTGISSIFTVIFGIITLMAGLNYNNEKNSLREFEKEIKEQLGRTDDSKVELYGINGIDLSGQELPVSVERNAESQNATPGYLNYKFSLHFAIIIKNVGVSQSGPLYLKIYSGNQMLNTGIPSSDEARYQYESYVGPTQLNLNSIPGKYTSYYHLFLPILNDDYPKEGKYPILLKIFYGQGKLTSAPAYLLIEQPKSPGPASPSSPSPVAR
jgi:hypothetical protein